MVAAGTFPTGKYYTGIFFHRKTYNWKIYPLAIAIPEFPYTGNSLPEKVRPEIIFPAFNRQSFLQVSSSNSYPTTWRMLLPLSVVIFPHNNKKEGKNAAAAS